MTLQGKRIVIIGGATGIGFAVAKGAIGEGAEVVIGSSRPANVQAAMKGLFSYVQSFETAINNSSSFTRNCFCPPSISINPAASC